MQEGLLIILIWIKNCNFSSTKIHRILRRISFWPTLKRFTVNKIDQLFFSLDSYDISRSEGIILISTQIKFSASDYLDLGTWIDNPL